MTMISPDVFIAECKGKPYSELIRIRDRLMNHLREFEESERRGENQTLIDYSYANQQVRYQVFMEYLSKLLLLMEKQYNYDYVSGRRCFKDDLE